MMSNNIVSATKLKRNISDVLHTVCFEKKPVVIERYGKPVAKIYPVDQAEKEPFISGGLKIAPKLKDLAQEQIDQGYYSSLQETINDALRKLLLE